MSAEEKPPSNKIIMDIGSADIPFNDIKSKQRMGIWDRFNQFILYPAGSSVCTRCNPFLMALQGE